MRHNIYTKYIRCDDDVNNHIAEKASWKNGVNVKFEYTPPGTPQRNGRLRENLLHVIEEFKHALKMQALRKRISRTNYALSAPCV